MRLVITKDYAQSARLTARHIARAAQQNPEALLGFATGTTPIPAYAALVEMVKKGELDLSRIHTVNLDEYVGLSPQNPNSYRFFMDEQLFVPAGVNPANVTIACGDAPSQSEELARLHAFSAAHRTDLQLLSVGVNGHIGFNEPDSVFHDGYHVVQLTQQTIESNARLFNSMEEVPRAAYTMGCGDIMRAKSIVFIATGENKHSAVRAMLEEGDVNPQIPATILKFHPCCTLYLDKDLVAGICPDTTVEVEEADPSL